MAKKTETVVVTETKKFTKEQFLSSNTYSQYKDYLSAVLDDKKTYSKEQVNNIIRKVGK